MICADGSASAEREQALEHLGSHGDRQQAVLQRVVAEDVGEAGADDGADAPGHERPRGVLARRAAAEVVARQEDGPARHRRPVQDELGIRRPIGKVAPVVEELVAQAGAVHRLEEAGRDDLVGIDVVARERHDRRRHRAERLAGRPAHSSALGSARRPVTADATAVSGEARNVRPPFPCRPSKFRLEVRHAVLAGLELVAVHGDAHRAAGLAPLGAGRAEDVAPGPSDSAWRFTSVEPGTTIMRTPVGDAAAADHAGRLAQVADPRVRAGPDEHDVDCLAEDRLAGCERHVLQRRAAASRAGWHRPGGRDPGCAR